MLPTMPSPPRPSDRIIARVRARLAARIAETGIPIARLAKRAGLSKVTVHRILGDTTPTRDFFVGTLANLADALLIDVRELFEPMPGEDVGASGSVKESTVTVPKALPAPDGRVKLVDGAGTATAPEGAPE
jgi:lambda repressor-like predicted transcriptional regulator